MDLIEMYCNDIPGHIDAEGIYPTPALIRLDTDKLEVCALAIEANPIIEFAFRNACRPDVAEQIVALDTYTQPGQGTELDSCLILFHMQRGQPARVGVLEYSWNNGQPVTKPVVWDNAHWCKAYEKLATRLTRAFR